MDIRQNFSSAYGAYGLPISGLEASDLLVQIPESGAERVVTVEQEVSPEPNCGSTSFINEELAVFHLYGGGCAVIERARRSATRRAREAADADRLVHPFLATAGAAFAYWDDRECLHGGAFSDRNGAWIVLAEKGGGKSSTLASLALEHVPVLTDDQVVIADGLVFAGPRCVDLRDDFAATLRTAATYPVREQRHRLRLPAVDPETPLRGFVILEWGRDLRLQSVPPAQRIEIIGRHRTLPLMPRDPGSLIGLAGLPMFILERPSRRELVSDVVDLLTRLGEVSG